MSKLFQSSLQNKFTYTLGGFGLFVAILVGTFGFYINEKLEVEVWRSTLESEFINYKNNYKQNIDKNIIEYGNLRIYRVDKEQLLNAELPSEISYLTPGIYDEVKIKNQEFCVLVRDFKNERVFLTHNITYLEETEFTLSVLFIGFLVIFFIVILYLSYFLGRLLVSPVRKIATTVSSLNPEERGLRIENNYNEFELSIIAKSINSYLVKMDKFVNREKDFIDTASHELRTPIAIISGAVDVLNAHPESITVKERALSRIKQSTKDIAESINALFLLSKDDAQIVNSAELFQLDDLVERIVSDHLSIFPEKQLTIDSDLDKTCLFASREATSIVLGNLVRNAIEHAKSHEIKIYLKNGILRIENQGAYIEPEQAALLFNKHVRGQGGEGNGIGLYLINRICESFNWKLDISSCEENRFIAQLDFSSNIIPCEHI